MRACVQRQQRWWLVMGMYEVQTDRRPAQLSVISGIAGPPFLPSFRTSSVGGNAAPVTRQLIATARTANTFQNSAANQSLQHRLEVAGW